MRVSVALTVRVCLLKSYPVEGTKVKKGSEECTRVTSTGSSSYETQGVDSKAAGGCFL